MVALLLITGIAVVAFAYFSFGRRKNTKLQKENAADTVELARKSEEMIDVSEKIICPQCKRPVPSSFSKCPGCGKSLKDE